MSMNYAGPVFIGLVLIALIDWVVRGRKFYNGPVREAASMSDTDGRWELELGVKTVGFRADTAKSA